MWNKSVNFAVDNHCAGVIVLMKQGKSGNEVKIDNYIINP